MKHVATIIDGKREVHMGGMVTDHDTACGIDMNDPSLDHFSANCTETKDPIDCMSCTIIWRESRKYKPSEFKNGDK